MKKFWSEINRSRSDQQELQGSLVLKFLSRYWRMFLAFDVYLSDVIELFEGTELNDQVIISSYMSFPWHSSSSLWLCIIHSLWH